MNNWFLISFVLLLLTIGFLTLKNIQVRGTIDNSQSTTIKLSETKLEEMETFNNKVVAELNTIQKKNLPATNKLLEEKISKANKNSKSYNIPQKHVIFDKVMANPNETKDQKIARLTKSNKNLNERLKKANAEILNLKKMAEEAKHKNDELIAQINGLRGDIRAQNESITAFKAELNNFSSPTETKTSWILDLVSKINAELATLITSIAGLIGLFIAVGKNKREKKEWETKFNQLAQKVN